MAELGISCRATSGYVTDAANNSFRNDASTATLSNGLVTTFTAALGSISRDRSTGVDARLAGIIAATNTSDQAILTVTLPGGPGQYYVRAALGDASGYGILDTYFQFFDNASLLFTINHGSRSGNTFYDANDALWSGTSWPGSNTRRLCTFSTSTFILKAGRGTGVGACAFAYLSFEKVAAAAPSGFKALLGVGV